jgi:hypothetical protein
MEPRLSLSLRLWFSKCGAGELSAELAILLIEGAQDKKSSVDLYYSEYQGKFPERKQLEQRLSTYLNWIAKAVLNFSKSRYRKPVDLYSLVGALDRCSSEGKRLSSINAATVGKRLEAFEREMKGRSPTGEAARYLVAASRQTDNITPRNTRIEILESILKS